MKRIKITESQFVKLKESLNEGDNLRVNTPIIKFDGKKPGVIRAIKYLVEYEDGSTELLGMGDFFNATSLDGLPF